MYTHCMIFIKTSTGTVSASIPQEVFELFVNGEPTTEQDWVEISVMATDSAGAIVEANIEGVYL